MRKIIMRSALLVLLVCSSVVTTAAQTIKSNSKDDEAAIVQNVKQMEEGWNKKSAALFAKPFADDADYVIINGIHIKGKETIEAGHQQIFETVFKDSTITMSAKQIRFLRPDVAVVHISCHNQIEPGEKGRAVDTTISLVVVKEKGEWKIAGFQNTAIGSVR
jgi:uncharacterized protein (TIGR02246 family)